MQVLQQTLATQQAQLLAEVATRDTRIQQVSQEGHHQQQALAASLAQVQAALATQRHEAEQVRARSRVPYDRTICASA